MNGWGVRVGSVRAIGLKELYKVFAHLMFFSNLCKYLSLEQSCFHSTQRKYVAGFLHKYKNTVCD